jgi:hypothetical protein
MKNHMHDFPIEYLEEIRDTVRGELLKPHLLTVKQQAENGIALAEVTAELERRK